MLKITINLDNPADLLEGYGAGALLVVERADDEAFTSPTVVTSLAILATQDVYEVWDAAGTDASWYRSRVTTSAGTSPSEWTAPFQAAEKRTYATLDSLREVLALPDNRRDNFLLDLLVRATDYLTDKCGRDFFRHPAVSGTETRLFDGGGLGYISVPEGIVSLSGVQLAGYTGGTLSPLSATDWVYTPRALREGHSYDGIILSDVASAPYFYKGYSTVELTGVFGFERVPSMIETATLDLAREWYRQGPGGGGPVGVNQYGTPIFGGGMPLSVKDAIAEYGVKNGWLVV